MFFVQSNEQGDQFQQARDILAGTLRGDDQVGRLIDRYCSPGDVSEVVRVLQSGSLIAKAAGGTENPPL